MQGWDNAKDAGEFQCCDPQEIPEIAWICVQVCFHEKKDFPGHLIGSGLLEVDDKSASGEFVYNFAVTLFPGLHGFLGISK